MRCYGCFEELNNGLNVCPHCGYVVGTEAEESIFMEPGTKVRNRYLIGRTIGFGGFGATYLAWDELLQQKVAVKEYLPSEFSTRMPGQTYVKLFGGDKTQQFHDGMKEFIEEAKRLAKFQNESGIVKIFDSFEENNTAYIIMEYLEGETLTAYLEREGIISEDKAVELLTPVMESLKKVHEEGLLHRDIAPDNIFITKDGEVKLIDFGAARYATTSHSRSLTVIIKPGYSPEEQYRSRSDQGAYTDVYALAATLYKMMTGVTPPDALERRAKYESKSQDLLVPPRKANKEISEVRNVALLNALNVRIEDRTPSIDAFMKELNASEPARRIYGKLKKIDIYTWPIWMKGCIAAAVLLIATLVVITVNGFDILRPSVEVMPDGTVEVPDVRGMKGENAISEIERYGLFVTTAGNIESEYIEPGKIVEQKPTAGMYIMQGETISLTISSGKAKEEKTDDESIVMPYIIWDTLEKAKEKLEEAGFEKITITEEYSDSVTAGQVISASIDVGKKVKKETEVAIVISKGVDPAVAEERAAQIAAAEEAARKVKEEAANNSSTSNNEAPETWSDWSYGSWITTKAATCTSEGQEERTKTRTSSKGRTETSTEWRELPALSHDWVDVIETVQKTRTTDETIFVSPNFYGDYGENLADLEGVGGIGVMCWLCGKEFMYWSWAYEGDGSLPVEPPGYGSYHAAICDHAEYHAGGRAWSIDPSWDPMESNLPFYQYPTCNITIENTEIYYEEVVTGQKCSVCGATK